jgi:LuxR family maltose regulon positive regulatory protein
MCILHLERGDAGAAQDHLTQCLELGDLLGLPQHPYRSRVAQARIDVVRGNLGDALEELREAERRYVSDFFPHVHPIPAMIARVQIKLGQLDDAARWAARSGFTVNDPISYAREYEHITLARLLIARSASTQVLPFIGRLREAAEAGGRRSSVVEIGVLEALTNKLAGKADAALDAIFSALELAAPEGQARPFLDEGEALSELLKLAARRGAAPAFVQRLLGDPSRSPPVPAADHPDLIEPLSDRESQVLRLLRSDLSGPDIARELIVSLNTVRTHTKNIFEKLGVHSRRAAVRRAEELQLFARARSR